MVELKWLLIGGGAVVLFGIALVAFTNNPFLVMIYMIFLLVLVAGYLLFQLLNLKKGPPSPYERLQGAWMRNALKNNPRSLGYLMLRASITSMPITLGRMLGFFWFYPSIRMRVANAEDEEKTKGKRGVRIGLEVPDESMMKLVRKFEGNSWRKLLIIAYKPEVGGIWKLPVLNWLVKPELFIAAQHQLYDVPGYGDLRLKGMTTEPLFCFTALSSVDLDKDYIASAINSEVERFTLEHFFHKNIMLIDDSTKSDGFQVKVKDIIGKEKQHDTGILR